MLELDFYSKFYQLLLKRKRNTLYRVVGSGSENQTIKWHPSCKLRLSVFLVIYFSYLIMRVVYALLLKYNPEYIYHALLLWWF